MSRSKSPTTANPGIDDDVSVNGSVESIVARSARTAKPREIVIAPVQLHRHSLKRRITEAEKPLNRFEITDESTVATEILRHEGRETRTLDRVDRFMHYPRILSQDDSTKSKFEMVMGSDPAKRVKVIEQARVAIAAITNLHPERVDTFRETADSLPRPVAEDAVDILDGVLALERALRGRTNLVPSPDELVRRATRSIEKSTGDVFKSVYPQITHLTVVGLSDVPAPLLDFVTAVSRATDVSVELVGRAVTRDYLQDRVSASVVETPGNVVTFT